MKREPDASRPGGDLDGRSGLNAPSWDMTASHTFAFRSDASSRSARPTSAFRQLDNRCRGLGESGLVYVEGPSGAREALSGHLRRRARAAHRPVLRVGSALAPDGWRELALRLCPGGQGVVSDIVAGIPAAAKKGVLIVFEGVATAWGRAVAAELERRFRSSVDCLVFLLVEEAPEWTTCPVYDVGAPCSLDDVALWLEATSEDTSEAIVPSFHHVGDLEAWWTATRLTSACASSASTPLSPEEERLLRRLSLARRSWSVDEVVLFGPRRDVDTLIARGMLDVDDTGRVVGIASTSPSADPLRVHARRDGADEVGIASTSPSADPSGDDTIATARILDSIGGRDAWAAARASELYAEAGDAAGARASAERALHATLDAAARSDLWRLYERAIELEPAAEIAARQLSAVELALRFGEAERALEFADAAARRIGETYSTMRAFGRAAASRGDLTLAGVALAKAVDAAPNPAARAEILASLADVRYRDGDFAEATRLGREAEKEGANAGARLAARNVIGKIHLAKSEWSLAESHFAADATAAACAGERTAELRAQLNRGISVLSAGRAEDARGMFLAVLEEGRRSNDLQAISLALQNLAVAAHLRAEYGEALSWYVEGLAAARQRGDKIPLANLVKGLAELRLVLNMVTEADETLRFGKNVCTPGMPPIVKAGFYLVEAKIHLARGRIVEAREAVRTAMAALEFVRNGNLWADCHCTMTRVALEEGDLVGARSALCRAGEHSPSPRSKAEVATLNAVSARQAGERFGDAAEKALGCAQEVGSEMTIEPHLILAYWHLGEGRFAEAATHVRAAMLVRDRLASTLPDDIRARFLGRPDFVELARLDVSRPPARSVPAREHASAPAEETCLARIVGEEPIMKELRNAIRRIGACDEIVLIRGESGTGKELIADALHEVSRRRGPLIKVNCAAFVDTLVHSELFGHDKGAFTGALVGRVGWFEAAQGGTLFLDEIGDLSSKSQAALLRVLQDGTFQRVGGKTTLKASCRVIGATHQNLEAMVKAGRFRADLYYRLEPCVLHVPALRARIGDLPRLAAEILRRISVKRGEPARRLSPEALESIGRYGWPGNIRQLENALQTVTTFADRWELTLEDLAAHTPWVVAVQGDTPPQSAEASVGRSVRGVSGNGASGGHDEMISAVYAGVGAGTPLPDMKRRIERECVARALGESDGNITRAARILGMKRTRLSQLVQQHGLQVTGRPKK